MYTQKRKFNSRKSWEISPENFWGLHSVFEMAGELYFFWRGQPYHRLCMHNDVGREDWGPLKVNFGFFRGPTSLYRFESRNCPSMKQNTPRHVQQRCCIISIHHTHHTICSSYNALQHIPHHIDMTHLPYTRPLWCINIRPSPPRNIWFMLYLMGSLRI